MGDSIEVSQLGGMRRGVTCVEESTTFLENVESPELLLVLNDLATAQFDLVNPVEVFSKFQAMSRTSRRWRTFGCEFSSGAS